MAKFSLVIECNDLSEAMAYVKALAQGGFNSKLTVEEQEKPPAEYLAAVENERRRGNLR